MYAVVLRPGEGTHEPLSQTVGEGRQPGRGPTRCCSWTPGTFTARWIARTGEFTPEQIEFLATIVRLYRGEDLNGYTFDPAALNLTPIQQAAAENAIRNTQYADIPGLCKVATRAEIAAQGWSLNPGRYVGVAEREADDGDWREQLEALNEELEVLNVEARELEERIGENVVGLLEDDRMSHGVRLVGTPGSDES